MRNTTSVGLVCAGLASTVIYAIPGIPEPPVTLFGRIVLNQDYVREGDDVLVRAVVPGGSQSRVVGEYHMRSDQDHQHGDNAAAGDHYVLRIELEHLFAGCEPSSNKVHLGGATNEVVNVLVRQGQGGTETRVFSLEVSQRGAIFRRNLVVGFPDLDADGTSDLRDFAVFQRCFTGGSGSVTAPGCAPADADNDNHVDLDDFAKFSRLWDDGQ